MSFTPSMSPEEAAKLDKKRGRGMALDDPSTDEEAIKGQTNMLEFLDFMKSFNLDDDDVKEEKEDLFSPRDKARKADSPIPGQSMGQIPIRNEDPVDKALTTRSFHIPRPLVNPDIQRSAMTPVTRATSKIYGPDGVAPLVGETMKEADEKLIDSTTYKSCPTHGIIHKSDVACHPCTLMKSSMCKACGQPMSKSVGGNLMCSMCG